MKKFPTSRDADKFVVRLPDGMREMIAQKAKNNHRSMNSQVVHALEKDLLDDSYPSEIVEPWNPVRGMLVQFKEGNEKVYGLDDFEIDEEGEVYAELKNGIDSIITVRLKELKPFMAR